MSKIDEVRADMVKAMKAKDKDLQSVFFSFIRILIFYIYAVFMKF